jgi:lipoprotein-anchoring transpeptidase ErfK/SrfK
MVRLGSAVPSSLDPSRSALHPVSLRAHCAGGDTSPSFHIRYNSFFSIDKDWRSSCTLSGRRQFSKGDAMTTFKLSTLTTVAATAVLLAVQAMGQSTIVPVQPQPAVKEQTPLAVKRVIVVSLEDRKLALVEDGQVKKVYTVAVGKPSTPSPVGTFTIERRVVNPTYHHNGKTVLPGPGNPVGTRWMGLSKRGYGIHGTNEPNSIGKAASHGCIRMAKVDLEQFYELVAEGDTVELVGERNEETAQLFGNGQNPAAPAAQQVQTAVAAAGTAPAAIPVQSAVADAASTEKAIPALSAVAALLALR